MGVVLLFELQQVDLALGKAVAHRQGLDDGTSARTDVAAAEEQLAGLRQQIADDQSRLRTLDLEIQSLRSKRAKVDADLYSGRIGNPKELAAMQEEVAALDRHAGHLEDEVLELMERVERLEAHARDGRERVAAAEVDLAHRVEAFGREAEAVDAEIAGLAAKRERLAGAIDEDLMRRYNRLREQKGGVAIVAVRGGTCSGCHVTIPERLLNRLERDPDLLGACDGCGRLLVVRGDA